MKKTLQNSMRESISSIDGASRNALHGFIFTNDSTTVAFFQEHETGNIHKLEPDTPITVISNSDEKLAYINITGKDVLETLTLDGQVAYAGADAFLAMCEALALLDGIDTHPEENRRSVEKVKASLSVDLEQNVLPYKGVLLIEDGEKAWKTTITADSHEELHEYGKVVTEQYRNGGLVNGE